MDINPGDKEQQIPTENLDNVDNNVVNGVYFDSNMIRKDDIEYFTKIQGAEERKRAEEARQKQEKFLQKAKKLLWDGWHKYVLFAIFVLIIATVTVAVLWTNVWKPQKEEREALEVAYEDYREKIANIGEMKDNFFKLYDNGEENEAWAYIENIIEIADESERGSYRLLYADILLNNFELAEEAIDQLLLVEPELLPGASKELELYLYLSIAYEKIGDQVRASEYSEKYDQLAQRGSAARQEELRRMEALENE